MKDRGSILAVDDTVDSLRMLADILRGEGYSVRAADSGALALASANVNPPELILLDIRMPGMDGFEVCRQLKANERTRAIPVIFLSASIDMAERVEGLRLGAVDFISKPFQRDEMLARVRMHMELGLLRSRLQTLVEQRTSELRLSDERLKLATQAANIGVWDWDIVRDELVWDESMLQLYGIRREEFSGAYDAWFRLVHPDDAQMADSAIRAALSGEKEYALEFRVIMPDGSIRSIQAASKTFRDTEGKPLRMIGTNIDITERKQAEKERQKLQAQLNQAQKMESVGRLAGGVAHDFNNMLGIILGHAEMAMQSVDPAGPVFAGLCEIRKAAERSAGLTRQLLAFARKQTVVPKVLDLNETMEGMLKMLHRLIGEDVTLAWLPGKDLFPVKIDPSQVDQILANLCVNARDAIAGVGKVTIETRTVVLDEAPGAEHAGIVPGEYALLAVIDDGCGMDEETLSKLFEPFFTTKGADKGTGLGLATVYGIVKQNDGFINVYSKPGQGTTFHIYLPRHESSADPMPNPGMPEPAGFGLETILLVEDEMSLLEITRTMLDHQGYTILAASTPREAIRMVEALRCEIHLLITDVIMPEMNGKDLADTLKALYPNLKCLFMSGYTADMITNRGVLDGALAFIQKPFSMQALIAKVRDALGKNQD